MFNKMREAAKDATKGVNGILFAREKGSDDSMDNMMNTTTTATTEMEKKPENVDDRVNNFFQKNKEVAAMQEGISTPSAAPRSAGQKSGIITNASARVRICKPKTYNDVEVIGQEIKSGKLVILDMNRLDENLATEILQFIYGICFAFDIAPENVDSKIISIDPHHKVSKLSE